MKKLTITLLFLLVSCFNFAGVNWHDELKITHWNGYTKTKYDIGCRSPDVLNQSNGNFDGRIETVTRLNKEGLEIMETKGCGACHQEGGISQSLLSNMNYVEQPADQTLATALCK